jgi:hypothetical protein
LNPRAASLAVVAVLLSCREAPRKPEPAVESTVSDPRPETAAPDHDNELAPAFPPVWRPGDHWQVTMITQTERSMGMGGFPGKVYGYVVYELRVAEVPGDEAGFYRIIARSVRADDTAERRFHVYYRKKPFSFARLVKLDDEGNPRPSPVWQQDPVDDVQPSIRDTFRFMTDFPIMPDPPRIGRTEYRSHDCVHPSVQLVEATGDGLRFTFMPGCNDHFRVVMDWKRGAKWWSSLGRFTLGSEATPEMYFDGSGLLLE